MGREKPISWMTEEADSPLFLLLFVVFCCSLGYYPVISRAAPFVFSLFFTCNYNKTRQEKRLAWKIQTIKVPLTIENDRKKNNARAARTKRGTEYNAIQYRTNTCSPTLSYGTSLCIVNLICSQLFSLLCM